MTKTLKIDELPKHLRLPCLRRGYEASEEITGLEAVAQWCGYFYGDSTIVSTALGLLQEFNAVAGEENDVPIPKEAGNCHAHKNG